MKKVLASVLSIVFLSTITVNTVFSQKVTSDNVTELYEKTCVQNSEDKSSSQKSKEISDKKLRINSLKKQNEKIQNEISKVKLMSDKEYKSYSRSKILKSISIWSICFAPYFALLSVLFKAAWHSGYKIRTKRFCKYVQSLLNSEKFEEYKKERNGNLPLDFLKLEEIMKNATANEDWEQNLRNLGYDEYGYLSSKDRNFNWREAVSEFIDRDYLFNTVIGRGIIERLFE